MHYLISPKITAFFEFLIHECLLIFSQSNNSIDRFNAKFDYPFQNTRKKVHKPYCGCSIKYNPQNLQILKSNPFAIGDRITLIFELTSRPKCPLTLICVKLCLEWYGLVEKRLHIEIYVPLPLLRGPFIYSIIRLLYPTLTFLLV